MSGSLERMDLRAVRRRAVEVLVVGAVVSPAVRDHDSFPLSTYPMYAFVRDRDAELGTARAYDRDGDEIGLSMEQIAGTDDPLIARDRVEDAIAAGEAGALCAVILRRAPAADAVVVVTERHDVLTAARGDVSLLESREHARCAR